MVGMKMMNNGHDGQSLLTWTTERSWRNSESDNDSENSDRDNSDSAKGIGDDNERTMPRAIRGCS